MYQHLSLSALSPENLVAVKIENCIAVLSTLIRFFSSLGLCLRDVLQKKKPQPDKESCYRANESVQPE